MTNYIQYTTLLKRQHDLNRLKSEGFKFIIKKNRFKVVCGVVCLSIAIFPNGTAFFMAPLGFMLLGINKVDLFLYKEKLIKRIKRF